MSIVDNYMDARDAAHEAGALELYELARRLKLTYDPVPGLRSGELEAAKFFKLAAEKGHAQSQCELGMMYAYSASVPRSFYLAARWFRRAAKQGHAGAMFNLACAYQSGRGAKLDLVKAARWERAGAMQMLADARANRPGQ